MFELFDTHAHLQEPEFSADLDAVFERALTAGVSEVLLPAVDLETGRSALAIAGSRAGVHVALGYHPHEASRLATAAEWETLEALLSEPRVVAVGEIGLDFYRMHSPADVQVRVLEGMLDLAESLALPVVVLCRDAAETLAPILERWAQRVAPKIERPLGVLHYFSDDIGAAQRYVDLGFLISIHTSATHPKADRLRAVAAAVPLEALLIETDSPYGAPQSHRGKRNEPAFVVEAAGAIAEAKNIGLEEVAAATTVNARRLFRIEAKAPALSGTQP
jgi:TatD DNase family protein